MFMAYETVPNCVPELYRSQFEDADDEFDREMREQERYLENRRKLAAAHESGLPVLNYGGYGACCICPHADHDAQVDAEDDFDTVICHDPACIQHIMHMKQGALT